MLRPRPQWLLLLSLSLSSAEILGPMFPAPTDLSSDDSLVKAAWNDLSKTFDDYLKEGKNTTAMADLVGTENVTWSTGLFSLHDAGASDLQYHWTSSEIANARNGTNKVDGDSIYRTASVSKLITAFVGQIELTQKQWHTPLSKLIPGLGKGSDGKNALAAPQWDVITPWALANQQAGVTTNGIPIFDLIGTYLLKSLTGNASLTALETAAGFPPEPVEVLGPCTEIEMPFCQAEDFLDSVRSLHPNLLPWTTPAYSNFGFMMLGLAISNATGRSYNDLYMKDIFEPLGMPSTFVDAPTGGPDFDRGVIVGPTPETGGFVNTGSQITIPSGGILSTINDMAKLGIGIMNSSLMTPAQTREWMKPHAHTASMSYSIGAPWEIVRFVHPTSGKVTDIYTKLGDSGPYGGILALIPDYDAGFSLLNAAMDPSVRSPVALNIISRITEAIVPALEAQAMAEAKKNFVGNYACPDGSLNSSLAITLNETTIEGSTAPSLSVSKWWSNGTDMVDTTFGEIKPQLQLYIPKDRTGAGKIVFQTQLNPQWNTYTAAEMGPFSGFYQSNFGWAQVDQSRYAGNGVDLFIFDVDAEGYAGSVRTAGTEATLKRVQS